MSSYFGPLGHLDFRAVLGYGFVQDAGLGEKQGRELIFRGVFA